MSFCLWVYVSTPGFGIWTNLEVILRWDEGGHGWHKPIGSG